MTKLETITSTDLWDFAAAIVGRYAASKPEERTDEARLLHALARDHLRMAPVPPERQGIRV